MGLTGCYRIYLVNLGECHGQLDVGHALINHVAIGGIPASIVRYTSLVDGIADRISGVISQL